MRFGILLIRWMLATSFLVHGTLKFVDLEGTIHFLGSLGLPPLLAILMSIGEVVGGIFLIFGILTPYVNVFYICVMLGSIFTLKLTRGYVSGYEFEIIHIVMNVAVMCSYSWKKWIQFYWSFYLILTDFCKYLITLGIQLEYCIDIIIKNTMILDQPYG